jgi:hypothetical protein
MVDIHFGAGTQPPLDDPAGVTPGVTVPVKASPPPLSDSESGIGQLATSSSHVPSIDFFETFVHRVTLVN